MELLTKPFMIVVIIAVLFLIWFIWANERASRKSHVVLDYFCEGEVSTWDHYQQMPAMVTRVVDAKFVGTVVPFHKTFKGITIPGVYTAAYAGRVDDPKCLVPEVTLGQSLVVYINKSDSSLYWDLKKIKE